MIMWPSYFNGVLIGASLIIAIGSQNAFVLAQSIRKEFHWPVALTCVLCDAALIALGVFGLASVLTHSPLVLSVARWGGIVFLVSYGLLALRRALRPQALTTTPQSRRSFRLVMATTLAVTLLNPHVYLDTVLLVGSLGAQQGSPGAYAAGAMSASLLWFSLLAAAGALLSKRLAHPATWRILDLSVAIMMFTLAVRLAMDAG